MSMKYCLFLVYKALLLTELTELCPELGTL